MMMPAFSQVLLSSSSSLSSLFLLLTPFFVVENLMLFGEKINFLARDSLLCQTKNLLVVNCCFLLFVMNFQLTVLVVFVVFWLVFCVALLPAFCGVFREIQFSSILCSQHVLFDQNSFCLVMLFEFCSPKQA